MFDILQRHAIDHVWCSPDQDYQYIMSVQRITPAVGVFSRITIFSQTVELPDRKHRYHVFTFGGVKASYFNVLNVTTQWKNLNDIITESSLVGEVFFRSGKHYPKGLCYLRKTENGNLIAAAKDLDTQPEIKTDEVLVRLYTNAFYASQRSEGYNKQGTIVKTTQVKVPADIINLQRDYRSKLALDQGDAIAFVNGVYVDDFIPSKIKFNDVIEYVYDPSYFRRTTFKVSDLDTYHSHLDDQRKYLLHLPKHNDRQTIEFEDDVDIYLYQMDSNHRRVGIYYYRPQYSWLRHVTHQDYGIPVNVIIALHEQMYNDGIWKNPYTDVYVELLHRRSGFKRDLIHEKHRIIELYRLDDTLIYNTLLGRGLIVDRWFAENLERSAYPKIMRKRTPVFTKEELIDLYGYTGIAKLTGDTPKRPVSPDGVALPVVKLDASQMVSSTIYEYDSDGHLITYRGVSNRTEYTCTTIDCTLVEIIPNIGTTKPDILYGRSSAILDPLYNYRVYVCDKFGVVPQWNWKDITNDTSRVQYDKQTNVIGIQFDLDSEYTAIVSDKTFLTYDYDLPFLDGVLEFHADAIQQHGNQEGLNVHTIPPRKVDVFLNGHALVQGIDYLVNWPRIVVINKQYIAGDETTLQSVHIRATGFCNPDTMEVDPPKDSGFVKHGYLSANRQFDVRLDNNYYAIVGGSVRHIDTLSFEEDTTGIAAPGVENGTPYAIRETIVPLRGDPLLDTYQLRDEDMVFNQSISDYLTEKLDPPYIDAPVVIPHYYTLYSPFINRIIDDMLNGEFDIERLKGHYSDSDVYQWSEPYNDLLEFEPSLLDIDHQYVKVHPHKWYHTIELSVYFYKYLERLVRLRLHDRIELNKYIKITLPGGNYVE